ncbi:hypothetical protein AV530_015397 [Patagioenas fasciata monilis]|uniref:Uncharacterized protein n=1 Tax=Patagioenas fasciata monilis TaxID=372326 RepID=A0A1V4JV70_PATFA|nr:hypothetical protein AV530_015397 [Patagioenas fasciata monilis]
MPAAEDLLFSTLAPSLSLLLLSEEVARSYSRGDSDDIQSETDIIYSWKKEKLVTITCKNSYCIFIGLYYSSELCSLQCRQQKKPW